MTNHAHSSGEIQLVPETPTVLIVEDDADTCLFYAEALRRSGFVVTHAANGREAIEELKQQIPDLILSDLCMPQMGGMALLQVLRADAIGRDIPYVVLTGSSDISARIACLQSGADEVLGKPIDTKELAVRLQLLIRQAQERRHLREQSYVDELTGVLNRRGVLQTLDRELSRVSRSTAPLAVLSLDVDDFKSINDTCGHAVGDEVLRSIAAAVVGAVRTGDVVGRLGGDEFLVLLPGVGQLLANSIAYRVLQSIAALRVPNSKQKLSVSIGIAVDDTGQVEVVELLDRADADMYRNKRNRRPNLKAL